MIEAKQYNKGMIDGKGKQKPLFIVIHNAASPADAESVATYNYNQTIVKKANTGFAHFYVDDKTIVQLVPDDCVAWHSGNSAMNKKSIGIEICVNPMNETDDVSKFLVAEQNTIDLVHFLMARWSIPESNVIFHSDVKNTACPYYTKKIHNIKTAGEFLKLDKLR